MTVEERLHQLLRGGAIHVDEAAEALTATTAQIRLAIQRLRRDGVPVENTGRKRFALGSQLSQPAPRAEELPEDEAPEETDEEILERLDRRFDALDRMVRATIQGVVPAIIISGPPGLGKSHGVRRALRELEQGEEEDRTHVDYISGSITAVGLYIALWGARHGGVVILDDCDQVFRDEEAMNVLKAALDSHQERIISWRKMANWLDELEIEPKFTFEGRIIFLTNLDFERAAQGASATSAHAAALLDRSLYLSLTIRSKRDIMMRVRQVVSDVLPELEEEELRDVLDFVEEHRERFYNLSLRLIHQIGLCRRADPENWKADVEMTKMRTM